MIKIAHISDLHIPIPIAEMPWGRFLNKRLIALLRSLSGRWPRFQQTHRKLKALEVFVREQSLDLLVCTGDYTHFGTEPEMIAAHQAVAPLIAAAPAFATVPGNHDRYLRDSVRQEIFEASFKDYLGAPYQKLGDLSKQTTSEETWPRIQLIGDEIAVVAVDGTRANPWVWRSSGKIPVAQLDRLSELLQAEEIQNRWTFVITHYAPRRADGTPDTYVHGLVNANDLLSACQTIPKGALLHGHIHHPVALQVPECRIPLLGAGTTTEEKRENLWLIECADTTLQAQPWTWSNDSETYVQANRPTFTAQLP